MFSFPNSFVSVLHFLARSSKCFPNLLGISFLVWPNPPFRHAKIALPISLSFPTRNCVIATWTAQSWMEAIQGRANVLRRVGAQGTLFQEREIQNLLQQTQIDQVLAFTAPRQVSKKRPIIPPLWAKMRRKTCEILHYHALGHDLAFLGKKDWTRWAEWGKLKYYIGETGIKPMAHRERVAWSPYGLSLICTRFLSWSSECIDTATN